jgi:hypothetical protein
LNQFARAFQGARFYLVMRMAQSSPASYVLALSAVGD